MAKLYFATEPAEVYRARVHDHYASAEESFQRCDTDGFLSQWASGQNARVDDALADLAEANGMAEVTMLCDLEGNIVNAKPIVTQYRKTAWALLDDQLKFTGQFLPFHPARPSTLAKKGYQEMTKLVPAAVEVSSYPGSYNLNVRFVAKAWYFLQTEEQKQEQDW